MLHITYIKSQTIVMLMATSTVLLGDPVMSTCDSTTGKRVIQ